MRSQLTVWHDNGCKTVDLTLLGQPKRLSQSYRSKHFCASEAAAMMGVSKYMTRSELLKQKATGITPDIDDAKQRLFDAGHQAEEQARPYAEEVISQELYPLVGTLEVEGLPLLASFDGITICEDIVWEHKLINADLIKSLDRGFIPDQYLPQLEQQLLVSGAEKALFMATSLCKTASADVWYISSPELRKSLIQGWKQFAEDLANYTPTEAEIKPTGRTPETLPALRIEVTGMVTASNLDAFKAHALAVFDGINKDLVTDQDFADAEKTSKWCGEVETRLAAAKRHALSQTESIDELLRTIDDLIYASSRVRIDLDKLVKVKKESIREKIVTDARTAFADHVIALNRRIGRQLMPTVNVDFGVVITLMATSNSPTYGHPNSPGQDG
jgi:predicted phage-related endonuclease